MAVFSPIGLKTVICTDRNDRKTSKMSPPLCSLPAIVIAVPGDVMPQREFKTFLLINDCRCIAAEKTVATNAIHAMISIMQAFGCFSLLQGLNDAKKVSVPMGTDTDRRLFKGGNLLPLIPYIFMFVLGKL